MLQEPAPDHDREAESRGHGMRAEGGALTAPHELLRAEVKNTIQANAQEQHESLPHWEETPENERAARLPVQGEVDTKKQTEPERRETAGAVPVTRLLRRFQSESRHYRRRLRSAIRLVVAGAGLVTLTNVLAILIAAARGSETLPFGFILASWLLYGLILCAVPIPVFRARLARDRLRDRLSGYDDIRVIGPLAEMLCASDPALHGAAVDGLIRLLPRLRRADACLLSAEQRDCLCTVLRVTRREETDLALTIVNAFAEVGEGDVLPLVERLAESAGRTRGQKSIRVAAAATLPTLKAHVRQEQSSRTLLRPSDGATAPDTLLRPASESATSDSDHLLRAERPPTIS